MQLAVTPQGQPALLLHQFGFEPNHRANLAKVILPAQTNNRAEIIALIMAMATARMYDLGRVKLVTDSNYIVELWNEGHLHPNNPKLTTYQNYDLLEILMSRITAFNEKGQLEICHTHGHTANFGNLEADYHANQAIKEYLALQNVIVEGEPDTIVNSIQRYVSVVLRVAADKKLHDQLTSGKSLARFEIGDTVTVRTHPLSQAGYGLTKKCFPRYSGQFRVVGTLGSNCYQVQDLDNPEVSIVANIRQLLLISRAQKFT